MIDEVVLKHLRAGYRQVAFPKGGSKRIRTRDDQNRVLVARGGYQCCQALLQILQRMRVERRLEGRDG